MLASPRFLAASLGVALASAAGPAAADASDARIAQALFDEARALMAQKRYAEACPKLEESQRRDPGGGTLLNLALCREAEGKTATAYVTFTETLSLATRDGRRDRQEIARTHMAALQPSLPRLTVDVQAGAVIDGLAIALDGAPLPKAAWSVAMPVDPGAHTVSAAAPGRAGWEATITVLGGEKKAVSVPPLAVVAEERRPPRAEPGPAHAEPGPIAPGPAPSESPRPNPVFFGLLGASAIAGGVSVVTGVLAVVANVTAKDGCIPERSYCKDQGSADAASRAGTMAWISTGALAVGAIGLGALFFVPAQKRATVGVGVGLGPGAVRLEGTF
jgi:serine/threonine-protein kinase